MSTCLEIWILSSFKWGLHKRLNCWICRFFKIKVACKRTDASACHFYSQATNICPDLCCQTKDYWEMLLHLNCIFNSGNNSHKKKAKHEIKHCWEAMNTWYFFEWRNTPGWGWRFLTKQRFALFLHYVTKNWRRCFETARRAFFQQDQQVTFSELNSAHSRHVFFIVGSEQRRHWSQFIRYFAKYGCIEASESEQHSHTRLDQCEVHLIEVTMGRIRIGYPAGYVRVFWIRIGFGYSFLKKIRSGQDQDIGLISITKFSSEWFKMSKIIVAVFFCYVFYFVSMCWTHHNQW